MKYRLEDIVEFNPTERLPKGTMAKKISMEKIQTFCRDVLGYKLEQYKSGAKFRNGDTIMARITPCLENGKSAYISFLKDGEIGYGSTEFIVWRAKDGISDSEYLYYLSISPEIRDIAVKSMVGTSGRQRVQQGVLNAYEVYLPPLPVQREIGAMLSALDARIANNTAINRNLEQMARAVFDRLYTDGESSKLGVLLDTIESGSRAKGGAILEGVPSIGAENIERFGYYDYSKEKYISREFFDRLQRGVVHSGDVLLYKDGAYTGKVSMALDGFPHECCAINEHVFILRTNSMLPSQFFLYFSLCLDENREKLFAMASSKAAQPGLNQGEVRALPILTPSAAAIREFDKTVAPFMYQIAINAIDNRRLAVIRDALIPKLLKGD